MIFSNGIPFSKPSTLLPLGSKWSSLSNFSSLSCPHPLFREFVLERKARPTCDFVIQGGEKKRKEQTEFLPPPQLRSVFTLIICQNICSPNSQRVLGRNLWWLEVPSQSRQPRKRCAWKEVVPVGAEDHRCRRSQFVTGSDGEVNQLMFTFVKTMRNLSLPQGNYFRTGCSPWSWSCFSF